MGATTGSYKVLVKDGDYGYRDGVYGITDYVAEYETFVEALKEFLDWSEDSDTKVVLTFKPQKAKKKNI